MSLIHNFPAEYKKTVNIVRRSAFYRDSAAAAAKGAEVEETIAEGIVCMLVPRTDAAQRRDAVDVRSGVPVYQLEWTALLEKPNPDIEQGDFLVRSDGSRLRVEAAPEIGNTMQLILREQGVL